MSHLSSFVVFFFLVNLILKIEPIIGNIPAVIVFGDSTVDAGNNNFLETPLKCNFSPYGRDFYGGKTTGRWSNGRVATDFISEGFGLKKFLPAYHDPEYTIRDFATGVDFASAGTGFDIATAHIMNVMSLPKELDDFKKYIGQLKEFVGDEKTTELVKNAMYVVSVGTNDFMENYYSPLRTMSYSLPIDQYEVQLLANADNFFTELYQLGARKVALFGLTPLGCLPLVRATWGLGSCFEKYNDIAKAYNVKLEALVNKLNKSLKGLTLVFSPLYDTVMDMINHPSKYGFENVDKGCCGTGMLEMSFMCNKLNPFTCSDADKYLFWDSFHPSQKTAEIVAKIALNTTLAQFRSSNY